MTESGIWWLGAIPAHWGVIQSRRLFEQRKERMRSGDEQLTASQKYGVIPQKDFMRLEDQSVMQVFTGADILKHVEPGDFVISMRSFQGGLEWCGYAGCVSSAYVGLTPIKSVVPGFFRYLFKSRPYIRALQSTSNLVRDGQALRFQNFAQVSLPLISDEEQTQIAKFLDYETAKIDALIEKQQQLIALLKEKRQAVISHAVTKGLNPDAPMRDSGVEWLGKVPAHWEV
ncbi:MAG: restriction endonuclease subunit S [Polyangiaceae bacterium]|nr:restriction endonuclease subunit S [Polyangiaceae bacterium]